MKVGHQLWPLNIQVIEGKTSRPIGQFVLASVLRPNDIYTTLSNDADHDPQTFSCQVPPGGLADSIYRPTRNSSPESHLATA